MDPEGFWTFAAWADQKTVARINDGIGLGNAKLIEGSNTDTPIITIGLGFHWQVEAIKRCAICGVQITFDETGEFDACHADQHEAGLDNDASFFA